MAIGDYGNNGSSNGSYNSNRAYEPSYYSRVRFRNGDKQMAISYHSGLMQIDIGSINTNDGFKFTPEGTVYISATKAMLLVSQISTFLDYRKLDNIDPLKAFGVNTGMGEKVSFIGFSTDNEKRIYVTIGKFNSNGVITEKNRFEFSHDYNYALEWTNIEANDIVKIYDNDIEIKALQQAFADFGRAMVGASAYGVADMQRWDNSRFNKRIDQIFDKLGIERQSYGNGGSRNYGTNNFLSGASSSSRTTSYEDVEDLLS